MFVDEMISDFVLLKKMAGAEKILLSDLPKNFLGINPCGTFFSRKIAG